MKPPGQLRRKKPLRSTPDNVVPASKLDALRRAKAEARGRAAHPGGSGLRRTPLARRSPDRVAFMAGTRAPAVRSAIEARRPCEVGVVLRSARLMRVGSTCLGRPSEDGPNEGWGFHERRKRSSAGSLINPRNLLWACPRCNGFVEAEPALMRAHFGTALVVREGDQEWDGLGKRADR